MRGWCIQGQDFVALILTHILDDCWVNYINSLHFWISNNSCFSYLLGLLLESDEITHLKAF